ncbi:hypothetical protein BDV93DRAFT_512875 [Ceratobasidium sp. AG-I]|nr:hypothetical protein BDV93DRAFT_512875 [Ceratobasidium sp. AG-I]
MQNSMNNDPSPYFRNSYTKVDQSQDSHWDAHSDNPSPDEKLLSLMTSASSLTLIEVASTLIRLYLHALNFYPFQTGHDSRSLHGSLRKDPDESEYVFVKHPDEESIYDSGKSESFDRKMKKGRFLWVVIIVVIVCVAIGVGIGAYVKNAHKNNQVTGAGSPSIVPTSTATKAGPNPSSAASAASAAPTSTRALVFAESTTPAASIASVASVASITSIASVVSIASVRSVASVASAASDVSVMSVMSVASVSFTSVAFDMPTMTAFATAWSTSFATTIIS